MQLIGMLDSPYVRRVAVTAQFLGVPYEHNPMSIFRQYDEMRAINPMVKVPMLVCDDGNKLVESSLIINYLETISESGVQLMPTDPRQCPPWQPGCTAWLPWTMTGVAIMPP